MLNGRRHNPLAVLCGTLFACLSASAAQQQTATGVAEEEPMVLEIMTPFMPRRGILHVRLVFRTEVVQLYTNTAWGEGAIKFAGRFEIPYNDELQYAKAVLLPKCLKYGKESLKAGRRYGPGNHGVTERFINGWRMPFYPHSNPHCTAVNGIYWSYAFPYNIEDTKNSVGWECVDCVSYSFRRGSIFQRTSIVRRKMTRSVDGSITQTKVTEVFSKSTEEDLRVVFKAACPEVGEGEQSGRCEEDNHETIECLYIGGNNRWSCRDLHYYVETYGWRLRKG